MNAPEWAARAAAVWAPVERLGGNEWAERERVLGPKESRGRQGRWRSFPWQVEILDALADPTVQWVVILKATQVGASELVRCAVGRWALQDPGDVLWVMTTELAARKSMKKLQEMFRSTPALRGLISPRKRDSTLLELELTNGMRIVIGWAGSAQSLSSDPFRYVILDEVAKYDWDVEGEGSPVDIGRDRTKAFGPRGKVVLLSSPRHEGDPIMTEHAATLDRRVFAVPCPACKGLVRFEWERVRWPGGGSPAATPTDPGERIRLADKIAREQSAWLACAREGCQGRVFPHRAQLEAGARWVQEEEAEPGSRRGYHVPENLHWETTLSGLVERYLRAIHPSSRHTFFCGALGRPELTAETPITAAMIEARAIYPAVVPKWATCLLATADTQLHGWWISVRAHGPGGRSRGLDWGWVETKAELLARGLRARFEVEGGGPPAGISAMAIDTGGGMKSETDDDPDGSRTKEVYELVRETPRLIAIKGEGGKHALDGVHTRLSNAVEGVELHLLNKGYYADELARLLRAAPVLWEEPVGASARAYVEQMTSEHKVTITTHKGSRKLWQKKSTTSPNHLWDCARYHVWLAEHMGVEQGSRLSVVHESDAGAGAGGEPPSWWSGSRGGSW